MGPLHPTLISTSYRLGRFPFIPESLSLKPTSWQSSPSFLEREEQTERGLLSEWAGNQPDLVYQKPATGGLEASVSTDNLKLQVIVLATRGQDF